MGVSRSICARAFTTASCARVRSSKWRDHVPDAVLHRERLQHVAAHEIGEVADGLHGDGLVEQVQRLLAVDAEAAAEGGAVGREVVEQLHLRQLAQTLAQRVDVAPEAGEMLVDRERAVGDQEEARRLAVRLLEPEHLGQRDVSPKPSLRKRARITE